VRVKGHFLPFEYYKENDDSQKGDVLTKGFQPDILYLWGQDLGKGFPVFQPMIVADSHDTSADHERPGLLVGFLKEIITPVKQIGDLKEDFREGWKYQVDEKTEYYLTIGNSCF
jgi:hypothetical protein